MTPTTLPALTAAVALPGGRWSVILPDPDAPGLFAGGVVDSTGVLDVFGDTILPEDVADPDEVAADYARLLAAPLLAAGTPHAAFLDGLALRDAADDLDPAGHRYAAFRDQ